MASQTVIVTVECDQNQRVDLALPLDVPSRVLAGAIAETIGLTSSKFYTFDFEIRQDRGIVRIPSGVTLGDAQILCGACLGLIKTDFITERQSQSIAHLVTADGKKIPVNGPSALLGRSDLKRGILVDIDLSALDTSKATSRRHASIRFQNGSYSISDQGSTNGTYLNGERLIPQEWKTINDGDMIEFGKKGPRLSFAVTNEIPE
jgi:hypothetical protein